MACSCERARGSGERLLTTLLVLFFCRALQLVDGTAAATAGDVAAGGGGVAEAEESEEEAEDKFDSKKEQ